MLLTLHATMCLMGHIALVMSFSSDQKGKAHLQIDAEVHKTLIPLATILIVIQK